LAQNAEPVPAANSVIEESLIEQASTHRKPLPADLEAGFNLDRNQSLSQSAIECDLIRLSRLEQQRQRKDIFTESGFGGDYFLDVEIIKPDFKLRKSGQPDSP
jgi:hypothetical protein